MTQEAPPLYTALSEIVGWTLDRTAGFPKNARFTFGQRLDNLSLDALQCAIRALYSRKSRKTNELDELNLILEQLRVLWRLTEQRTWISGRQLLYIVSRIDEVGRMVGGWRRSLNARTNEP